MADRGLLSLDNLEALQQIRLPSGEPLEFVLAAPGRRYNEFVPLLESFHQIQCQGASSEVTGELTWNGLRLVVAHDPVCATEQTQHRRERITTLLTQGDTAAGKPDGQPERALACLRRIQYHRIQLDAASPISGVSTIQDDQSEILRVLNVKKPAAQQRLALL